MKLEVGDIEKLREAVQTIYEVVPRDNDRIMAAYLHIENVLDPVYCPECGSCGEPGCCSPDMCKTVQGLYCEENVREYREMEREWAELQTPRGLLKQAWVLLKNTFTER